MHGPEIRFSKVSGVVSLLEIVQPARRSVLETVRALLHDLRIQVVRVESIVTEPGLVERFYLVEFDGAPIHARRASLLRQAVERAVGAVDAAA